MSLQAPVRRPARAAEVASRSRNRPTARRGATETLQRCLPTPRVGPLRRSTTAPLLDSAGTATTRSSHRRTTADRPARGASAGQQRGFPERGPRRICACAKRRPSPGTQRWVRGAASRASRRSCPLLHQEGVDLPPPARSRRGWPAIGGCEDDATSQQPVLAPASVPSRNSVWWPRQRRRYVPSGRAQRSAGSCRRRHRPARPAIEPGR